MIRSGETALVEARIEILRREHVLANASDSEIAVEEIRAAFRRATAAIRRFAAIWRGDHL